MNKGQKLGWWITLVAMAGLLVVVPVHILSQPKKLLSEHSFCMVVKKYRDSVISCNLNLMKEVRISTRGIDFRVLPGDTVKILRWAGIQKTDLYFFPSDRLKQVWEGRGQGAKYWTLAYNGTGEDLESFPVPDSRAAETSPVICTGENCFVAKPGTSFRVQKAGFLTLTAEIPLKNPERYIAIKRFQKFVVAVVLLVQ